MVRATVRVAAVQDAAGAGAEREGQAAEYVGP